MDEMLEISKKAYEELQDQIYFLECLRVAGVDNWDGYDYAWALYEETHEG